MPRSVFRLTTAIAFVTLVGTPGRGAPALKERTGSDGGPDLTALHALIRKIVENGKELGDKNEQQTTQTIRTLLHRVTQAASVPERDLPVKFDGLKKYDVAKEFEQASVQLGLVVGGDVRGTRAADSIVLAAGEVQFTSVDNCVIVGKTVRFTGARNCLIIAEEFVRGTGVGGGKGEPDGSVIVSGRWIRLTRAQDAICHVLRPGNDPAPDDRKGLGYPPIRMTGAENVRFLNKPADVGTTGRKDCQCVELKSPLAK